MQFRRLAEHFEGIERETKRLELVALVLRLLRDTPTKLVDKVLYLAQGRVYPDFMGIELGVAEKLTLRALSRSLGVPEADIVALAKQRGDLGLAAEEVLGRRRQSTLGGEPLTVAKVYGHFERIARATGTGSQDQKLGLLADLLHNATPLEARYLVRIVSGKLRLGVADQTLLEALALFTLDREATSVQELDEEDRRQRLEAKTAVGRSMDVTSDIARVAKTLREEGLEGVRALSMEPGVPIRPMLAERTVTLEEALAKVGGVAQVEYKYDGLRVQAHVGERVDLFSRRLERITEQFPDLVEAFRAAVPKGRSVIVEGEVVAIDAETGRILPFQILSTRRGRKYGLGAKSAQRRLGEAEDYTKRVPVRAFLFDVLMIDEEDVSQRPLRERRRLLAELIRPNAGVDLGEAQEYEDADALEAYFDRVCAAGAEGIMVKNPGSPYQPGNRGWHWIKFKADYQEGLSDSFDLAVIGAFWGQGRRGGWYGALLLATVDEETGRFQSVCRVATGFDDETLRGLESRFRDHVVDTPPANVDAGETPHVWLRPDVVMEIVAAEVTLSPRHRCAWGLLRPDAGLSLRFPRFTGRWRDDKSAPQATTSQEILRFFERRTQQRGGGAT